MKNSLSILFFEPILKEKIWGGQNLSQYGKKVGAGQNIGESWEISGVQGDVSVVSNGLHKGKSLNELIEEFGSELLGKYNFEKFGNEFPLLIKFLDAEDDLSVQVHPDDKVAQERHNSNGKTEMWFILDHKPKANLIIGFNRPLNKSQYMEAVSKNKIMGILNTVEVAKGDAFYIPAGRVHSIGKGIVLAEIQQTSDVTYRIYDFDRKDADGNGRELHNEEAMDVVDLNFIENFKTDYTIKDNKISEVAKGPYFSTNILKIEEEYRLDYTQSDRFHILICIEGSVEIKLIDETYALEKGQTVLIPAIINQILLMPQGSASVLETYVP
jgi:mannose-6-phosphate isomerase